MEKTSRYSCSSISAAAGLAVASPAMISSLAASTCRRAGSCGSPSAVSEARRARSSKNRDPDLAVLFLTMHEALRTGAAGLRDQTGRGDVYVHPAMTRGLLCQPLTRQHRRGVPQPALTPRELDVLRLLARATPTARSPVCSGSRSAPWRAIAPT